MKLLSKGRWSMELNERAKLLLAKAKDDETLLDEIILNEKIRDEIIGFHARQAAEKLLKALLMAKNILYRRTHDLRELIDLIRDNDIEFPMCHRLRENP
jgi:HEPN domain-containing protein